MNTDPNKEYVVKNAVLQPHGCAACGLAIDPNWSRGGFAAKCRDCSQKNLFTSENFDFRVVCPQGGSYDFAGTRLMVNGRVGTLVTAFGNWSWIEFDDEFDGTIHVGWWELKRLYESSLVTT